MVGSSPATHNPHNCMDLVVVGGVAVDIVVNVVVVGGERESGIDLGRVTEEKKELVSFLEWIRKTIRIL